MDGGPPVFPRRFLVSRGTLDTVSVASLHIQDSHPLWLAFPDHSVHSTTTYHCPKPRRYCYLRFGLFRFRSPLLAESRFDFSSSPYLDVSVQAVPFLNLWIQLRIHGLFPCEFPHSDICGSTDICSSPQLFAAYRVLLRLLMPRHPPCALSSLTYSFDHFTSSLSSNYMATSDLIVILTDYP